MVEGHQEQERREITFLFDVDNTLLDNDHLLQDFRDYLIRQIGADNAARYWAISEWRRSRLGYVDYLGALQDYRAENVSEQRALAAATYLLDYPFSERLYPDALAVLEHLGTWGPTVIVSDGDAVFQPHKILHSKLAAAVAGRVLIYIHKESMLSDIERQYPADHYVMIDDKRSILSPMKKILGARLTTVFPQQGHYALDPQGLTTYAPADICIEHIGDLLQYNKQELIDAAAVM